MVPAKVRFDRVPSARLETPGRRVHENRSDRASCDSGTLLTLMHKKHGDDAMGGDGGAPRLGTLKIESPCTIK